MLNQHAQPVTSLCSLMVNIINVVISKCCVKSNLPSSLFIIRSWWTRSGAIFYIRELSSPEFPCAKLPVTDTTIISQLIIVRIVRIVNE